MYVEIYPARAKSSHKQIEQAWGGVEFVAEPKIDGWRFLMHVGSNLDRVYLTGRRVSQKTGRLSEKGLLIPQIWPADWHSPGYTVLDGEITVPGGFRSIAGIMNTDPRKAAARIAELGVPTYHVFDVLFHNFTDVRSEALLTRRKILDSMVGGLISGSVVAVQQQRPERSVYDRIVADGGEGIILKDLTEPYGSGWLKVKRSHTLDVVVTGFTRAKYGRTGKYYGQIGAAQVSVYAENGNLIEVGQVSGMTDAVRKDMTDNQDRWIGHVIEIESQEFARHRLRHPRYKRRRDDLDPRCSTFSKMMADLGQSTGLRNAGQLTLI